MNHLESSSPKPLKMRFRKLETALMGYSGSWRKLIHEKKLEVENLVALSLLSRTSLT
jgi:hypothetical protein